MWRFGLVLVLCAGALAAQETLPTDHPKYAMAHRVLTDLIRAIGDGRPAPALHLLPESTKSRKQITWYDARAHRITLEERAYDRCIAQGPDSLDALAFLLGHELAHFYLNHAWAGDFGNAHADLGIGQTFNTLQQNPARQVALETQADYFGGFFGHVAGYRALDAAGPVLTDLYAVYGLEDSLRGYPTLTERRHIVDRARQQLAAMVPVFEAANALLMIGRYEEAGRCFDYVARTFPSRELFNNAGMARALEALELFEPADLPFSYPFELDATTRLGGPDQKAGETDPESARLLRRRLLHEARDFFAEAHRKDPAYTPASINLACTADLLGQTAEAAQWTARALELARAQGDTVAAARTLIARGIARARDRDIAAARTDFEAALQASPSLARHNLEALLPPDRPQAQDRARRPRPVIERIGQTPAAARATIIRSPDTLTEVPAVDASQPAIDIYAKRTTHWYGLVLETGYSTFCFLKTSPYYTGATALQARRGHSLDRVFQTYGPPRYRIAAPQGLHGVYRRPPIVFHADSEGRVQGWTLYSFE